MESQINGQVLGVTGRAVKDSTIYDIAFSDGNKYSTFDQALATTANGLVGQQVSASVEVAQTVKNGKTYTNFNLRGIAPLGQLPAAPSPSATFPQSSPAPGIPITPQSSGGWTPEKEQRVTKLAVFGTAYEFVGQLFAGAGPEAYEQAVELADGLAKKLFHHAFLAAPQINPTPAVTPAAVADVINQEVPGAVAVGTDGIPW